MRNGRDPRAGGGRGVEVDSQSSGPAGAEACAPAKSPPNEDWRNITDPVERRRIRNRVNQRVRRQQQRERTETSTGGLARNPGNGSISRSANDSEGGSASGPANGPASGQSGRGPRGGVPSSFVNALENIGNTRRTDQMPAPDYREA